MLPFSGRLGRISPKGGENMFDFQVPQIEIPTPPIAYSYSDTQVEIIKEYILAYQASLDPDKDVALLLTHFGNSILMEVTHIGYEESVLVVFKGLVNGRESVLIQHVSQLNFLLTSVDKSPDIPKRKIGFTAPKD